jgi:hypothetical protein
VLLISASRTYDHRFNTCCRKIPFGILKRQWEDDIKMYRTEVRCENVNWTQGAKNGV